MEKIYTWCCITYAFNVIIIKVCKMNTVGQNHLEICINTSEAAGVEKKERKCSKQSKTQL